MIIASDLEGTLTTGTTWRGFGRYLRRHGRALPQTLFLISRLPGVPLARAGIIDKRAYQVAWIADEIRLLRGATPEQIEQMGEWVVEHEMWPRRRADVLDELEAHRRDGARIVIVSGAYQPIADAFARRIGAEAIGTPLLFEDGDITRSSPDARHPRELPGSLAKPNFTGRLAAPMVTLDGKVQALRALLGDGARIDAAYGDTLPDLPMLEMSAGPVAVYPDAGLRAVATGRGWRIVGSNV